MKEYIISKKNATNIIRNSYFKKIPQVLIAASAGLFSASFFYDSVLENYFVLITSIVLTIISLLISNIFWIRRRVNKLKGIKYNVSDRSIKIVNENDESKEILFKEIISCKESKKGLLVKSNDNEILIHKELDLYEELGNLLHGKLSGSVSNGCHLCQG